MSLLEPQAAAQVTGWTNYAGPVAAAYEHDRAAAVAVIVGPTGGGKSQASARKIIRVALNQHPSPRDGVRKARIYCVAPTYRTLWDAPIPSFRKVWTDSLGTFSGGKGDPADYIADLQTPAGRLHLEVHFRAIRDESAEEFVRGKETTAWWFPEMDTMPAEDLISLASNRVGRYPEPDDRPDDPTLVPAYAGVFGDANAPVVGSWFFDRFYKKSTGQPGDKLYRQPAFDAPDAENIHNLRKIRPDYYADLASRMQDYDIGRLLRCQPGYSRFGKPVHEHFDTRRNISTESIPAEDDELLTIGADAGNTLMPAATFGQRAWSGQQRVLAEIAPRMQMDLIEFATAIRRVKETRFRHVKRAVILVDPSARAKSATNRQLSFAQILQAKAEIEVRLAPSNDPTVRRSALDRKLTRNAKPGEPAYIVSGPDCPGLIESLCGGYRFRKVKNAWSLTPDKTGDAAIHTHIADAEQYRVLGDEGLDGQAAGFIHPYASAAYVAPVPILAG